GYERLRTAGIQVESGLLEAQARLLNRGFISRLERGRPWLRVKLATSLDGRSALASGDSKWISGEPARADVHRWRARAGALLTGAGTVLVDDPHLTVRLGKDANGKDIPFVAPLRVVLDPGLATVARGHIREGAAPTLYLHAPDARMPRGIDAQHAHVLVKGGRFDLDAVLALLAARASTRSRSRPARPWRVPSWVPAWWTNCCCMSRQCCWANRRGRCSMACRSTRWRSG